MSACPGQAKSCGGGLITALSASVLGAALIGTALVATRQAGLCATDCQGQCWNSTAAGKQLCGNADGDCNDGCRNSTGFDDFWKVNCNNDTCTADCTTKSKGPTQACVQDCLDTCASKAQAMQAKLEACTTKHNCSGITAEKLETWDACKVKNCDTQWYGNKGLPLTCFNIAFFVLIVAVLACGCFDEAFQFKNCCACPEILVRGVWSVGVGCLLLACFYGIQMYQISHDPNADSAWGLVGAIIILFIIGLLGVACVLFTLARLCWPSEGGAAASGEQGWLLPK